MQIYWLQFMLRTTFTVLFLLWWNTARKELEKEAKGIAIVDVFH